MKVTKEKWLETAKNLDEWRKNRKTPPNLELYKKIVSLVGIGEIVLDVGAGQCWLEQCLPYGHTYIPIDPFPVFESITKIGAEDLFQYKPKEMDTVFMLAALDNVQYLRMSLEGLKHVAKMNIVILTGIDIEPDKYHTHKITKKILYDFFGKPLIEKEMLTNVWLFEWLVK